MIRIPVLGVMGGACCALAATCDSAPVAGTVTAGPNGMIARLSTPFWEDKCRRLSVTPAGSQQQDLMLQCLTAEEDLRARYEPSNSTSVVVQPALPVFRYRNEERKLEPAAADPSWAAGIEVPPLVYRSIDPFTWDQENDQLLFGGSALATFGRWTVTVSAAPDEQRIGVLSANGTRKKGLQFLGGGRAFFGEHFFEIRDKANGRRVGEVVRLAQAEGLGFAAPTWSTDGRHVVFSDLRFSNLWIIPVPSQISKETSP